MVLLLPPVFLSLLTAVGCHRETPRERISAIRQSYDVKLNMWRIKDPSTLTLDLIVTHTSHDTIPLITAELYHYDAAGKKIGKLNVPIKTAEIPYGVSAQINVNVDISGMTIADGDGFGLKYFKYPTTEQMNSYEEYRENPS